MNPISTKPNGAYLCKIVILEFVKDRVYGSIGNFGNSPNISSFGVTAATCYHSVIHPATVVYLGSP